MSMNLEDYMKYRERREQATLEEFEVVEEWTRRELTPKEKLALRMLQLPEHWNDLDGPSLVMEKAKANVYIESLGIKCSWLIDYGFFLCSFCRKDGTKHKLQKVKYIGCICKECALKYRKKINDMIRNVNAILRFNN